MTNYSREGPPEVHSHGCWTSTMTPGGILDSTNQMSRNLEAQGFVNYNSIKKEFLVKTIWFYLYE